MLDKLIETKETKNPQKENPMNGKYRFVPDVAEHDLYMYFSYKLYYFIYLKQCIFLMTTMMMMMRERRGKRKMKNIKEKQFIKKISNVYYLFWIKGGRKRRQNPEDVFKN